MDRDRQLTQWAVDRGLFLNGVAVYVFPDKGLGIVADKDLREGDLLMSVPMSAIRTADTVASTVAHAVGACSVNGLLAADLALDTSDSHAPWRSSLPKPADLQSSMPLRWPAELQDLLPAKVRSMLQAQQRKLASDWDAVAAAFPDLAYDEYRHAWLLVNTRTFYYTGVDAPPGAASDPNECLAIVPFADYFNHAEVGCAVSYSPSGYEVRANRPMKKGDEVHLSYGRHGNDFLLVEYGFILDANQWDETSLDGDLLPLLSANQQKCLQKAGYWGNYVLDGHSVCYRTQVAVRLRCMSFPEWKRALATGFDEQDRHATKVAECLLMVLTASLDRARETLRQIRELSGSAQRDTLTKRWEQIHALTSSAITRLKNELPQ